MIFYHPPAVGGVPGAIFYGVFHPPINFAGHAPAGKDVYPDTVTMLGARAGRYIFHWIALLLWFGSNTAAVDLGWLSCSMMT